MSLSRLRPKPRAKRVKIRSLMKKTRNEGFMWCVQFGWSVWVLGFFIGDLAARSAAGFVVNMVKLRRGPRIKDIRCEHLIEALTGINRKQ